MDLASAADASADSSSAAIFLRLIWNQLLVHGFGMD